MGTTLTLVFSILAAIMLFLHGLTTLARLAWPGHLTKRTAAP